MINAIKQIGELVKEKDFIKSLVKFDNKIKYIVRVNFDINKQFIDFFIEEADTEKLSKYYWLGNASGNSKQIYYSTDNLGNILSSTINDIFEYLTKDVNNDNNEYLDLKSINYQLLSLFFLNTKENEYFNNLKEHIFYIDYKKIKGFDEKLKDYNQSKSEKEKINPESFLEIKDKKIVVKKYITAIKTLYGFNEKNEYNKEKKYLYTVFINNISIFENSTIKQSYLKLLEFENLEKLFLHNGKDKKYLLKDGTCSVCGNSSIDCTSKEYALKIYIQDKPGFSSYFDGNFTRNFSICKECYKKSFTGKSYLNNKLKSNIKINSFYLIPYFIYKPNYDIDSLSKVLKDVYNPISNILSLTAFHNMLSDVQNFEEIKNCFILTYLFFMQKDKKNPDSLKVIKEIKDVKPHRFEFIIRSLTEINNLQINSKIFCKISLKLIYFLIPQKIGKKSDTPIIYLNILEAMLKQKQINEPKLIQIFLNGIRIIIHEQTDNYNMKDVFSCKKSNSLQNYVLTANLCLLMLYKIKSIKGENKMTTTYDNLIEILTSTTNAIEKQIKEENKNLNYSFEKYKKLLEYFIDLKEFINSEQKIGLILLGYLVSEIGYQQYKKLRNKPILKKIKYSGMNINDLIKFSNAISEKMLQYDIIIFNELLLFIKDKIFINNMDKWELSISENVFFILTGYSLGATYLKTEKDITVNVDMEEDIDENIDEEDNSEEE